MKYLIVILLLSLVGCTDSDPKPKPKVRKNFLQVHCFDSNNDLIYADKVVTITISADGDDGRDLQKCVLVSVE